MSEQEDIEEYNLKVLVVGEPGVGKTSIIHRFTQGNFVSTYKPTLGADFALKIIQWNSKLRIHLQLWDIAGHERYGQMTRVYYKYAMAAFIVYDISRSDTFNAVIKWHKDLIENIVTVDEESIPIVLLGNKCDLNGVGHDVSYLNSYCHEHGLHGWFPISAKANKNIDDAMSFIVSIILSKQPDTERVRPGTPWFRAQSPTPRNELNLHPPSDNERNERTGNSTYKEHKSCC